MKKKTHFISTTVGKAFNLANDLPINWIIGVQTKERISDLFLGPAKSFHSVLKFNNVTLVGKAFPECKVESHGFPPKENSKLAQKVSRWRTSLPSIAILLLKKTCNPISSQTSNKNSETASKQNTWSLRKIIQSVELRAKKTKSFQSE